MGEARIHGLTCRQQPKYDPPQPRYCVCQCNSDGDGSCSAWYAV